MAEQWATSALRDLRTLVGGLQTLWLNKFSVGERGTHTIGCIDSARAPKLVLGSAVSSNKRVVAGPLGKAGSDTFGCVQAAPLPEDNSRRLKATRTYRWWQLVGVSSSCSYLSTVLSMLSSLIRQLQVSEHVFLSYLCCSFIPYCSACYGITSSFVSLSVTPLHWH